jgi:predicted Rossmann-fold nucleotide-binding protein
LHDKPIIIFNQDGYWDPMIALMENMVDEGFSQPPDRTLYKVANNIDELLTLVDENGVSDMVPIVEKM